MKPDPLHRLPHDLVGRRVSVRLQTPAGDSDRIGLVLALDAATLTLEDRAGDIHLIDRATIRLARLVPTVARGRNPRHAPADMVTALARDLALQPFDGPCWIARLCDLVDHLDDSGVRRDSASTATRGESRGLVNGEWSAFRLASATDLRPLAAWAARHNARNVVLTSRLPASTLAELGLQQL